MKKGTIIKEIRRNSDPMFKNTTANSELTYRVTKVNQKTYTLECIEGYFKGSSVKLSKDFKAERIDVYGTITQLIVVEV